MIEISVMEKAISSSEFATLRLLLEKAFRGSASAESKAVIAKYVEEGERKLKRILTTLN